VLAVESVTRRFRGMDRPAVSAVSFRVNSGEILGLAGPSGSGKTTVLRMIAGFERVDGGRILIDGREVVAAHRDVPAERRRVGFVFQDYALFPHLSVAANVGLKIRNVSKTERHERVMELLERADVGELARRYPHEISGGQAQRVALLRALAPRPSVVLMDEPFSNLDHACTHRILLETRQILQESGATAVVVTHDRYESFTLADRVAVLDSGTVLQTGSPQELYGRPASIAVAEFSGAVSFFPVTPGGTDGGEWTSELGPVPSEVAVIPNGRTDGKPQGSPAYVAAVRTNQIAITRTPSQPIALVTDTRFLGSVSEVHVRIDDTLGKHELVIHQPVEEPAPPVGARVGLRWTATTPALTPG